MCHSSDKQRYLIKRTVLLAVAQTFASTPLLNKACYDYIFLNAIALLSLIAPRADYQYL